MNRLIHGDCAQVLPILQANTFDSLVTDPPASISFRGTNGMTLGYKKRKQMRARARLKKAYFISLVFSVTKRSLRKPCSHEFVRSTTHRNRPKLLPCWVRRLANLGSIPRARSSSRWGSESYARSPY